MSLITTNQSAWNKKTVLFVHGIGIHPAKYSEPLMKLLRTADPALADATRWHEVAYDSVSEAMEKKVIQFKDAIPTSIEKPEAKAVVGDMIIDLVDYLINADPYNWINTIFKKELVDIVEAAQHDGVDATDHEIFIISHSLGTVVTYETLHAIINDPQTLGLSSNFKIKTLFTLGCPLAFIKANQKRIPSMNKDFFLRNGPIQKSTRINQMTDEEESNIDDWYNLAQQFDPVANLVPLTLASSNHFLTKETMTFKAFHAGANPHAFENYITEYSKFIMEEIRG